MGCENFQVKKKFGISFDLNQSVKLHVFRQ